MGDITEVRLEGALVQHAAMAQKPTPKFSEKVQAVAVRRPVVVWTAMAPP